MSIEQGLLIVLVGSLACEAVICAFCRRGFCFLMSALIPFVASVCLYWLPNLGRFHDAELRVWFPLFFAFWFVPSMTACVIAVFIISWLRRRLSHKKNESI